MCARCSPSCGPTWGSTPIPSGPTAGPVTAIGSARTALAANKPGGAPEPHDEGDSMSVNRRDFLLGTAVGAGVLALPVDAAVADVDPAGGLRVESTTVEYAETLLGTDVAKPRLSWVLAADSGG